MNNCMAICTEGHQVSFRVHGFGGFELRNGLRVVNVDKTLRVLAVCLSEIKTARLASYTMNRNCLETQRWVTLVADPVVGGQTALGARLKAPQSSIAPTLGNLQRLNLGPCQDAIKGDLSNLPDTTTPVVAGLRWRNGL